MVLAYQTTRLSVVDVFYDTAPSDFLVRITALLTPNVVENLPPYFDKVNTIEKVQDWYQKMVSESRLFAVKQADTKTIIGFVFVYNEPDKGAHIGYLLGELYWNKGYATELLQGLIKFAIESREWTTLIAGVDKHNTASSKLLLKLGFIEQEDNGNVRIFHKNL